MNASKFRFTLDLQRTQSQVSIPITRGDTGRTWYISFSDGSLPFALGEGCLAKLEIKRPTGTFLEEFCPIENGTTVKYAFSQNENTAAVEGLHECAVILYGTDGETIGSPRFTMIVTDRVISSDDINLSDENKTTIDTIIAAEASRQEAEEGRINAEAARVSAEAERAAADEVRAGAFDSLKADMEAAASNVVSPTVSVEQTDGGYQMKVTDGNGEASYYLPAIMSDGTSATPLIAPNPSEEATETLTKIKIGNTVYGLPEGGGAYETYGGEYEVIE